MAKFKVGEKAVFRQGPWVDPETPLMDKQVVTVYGIDERPETYDHVKHLRHLPGTYYKVEEAMEWWILEQQLEKLLPKHQDADLKVAEPHFINHQLPRWLHQEEKKHERA